MINEERVREMYQMAVFDEYKEKKCRQMGQYYKWDYVAKEMLKSFFSGTIAYMLLVVLWVLSDITAFTAYLNSPELIDLVIRVVILYVAFIAIYLIVTAIVYNIRYRQGHRQLRKYMNHLKRVHRMYTREDKLKA